MVPNFGKATDALDWFACVLWRLLGTTLILAQVRVVRVPTRVLVLL